MDLLPHLDVDVGAIRDALTRVMPDPRVIAVSSKTGEGISEWLTWLEVRARFAPRNSDLASLRTNRAGTPTH
jgi:hydrogenase nickel incorporation protein HypB